MRNTLLSTTALVLSAGIASADGHATISWSGTATAGIARDGERADGKIVTSKYANVTTAAEQVSFLEGSLLQVTGTIGVVSSSTVVTVAELATARASVATFRKLEAAKGTAAGDANVLAADYLSEAINGMFGTLGKKTSDWNTYSEVNATVTGSVSAGDVTMTAAMSVDAGKGYTFASDKTFDTAKTNGVSLDNVSIDMGAMGKIKIDDGAVAHLVDGDDDTNADILYTNTLGSISISAAMDIKKDTDVTAKNAVFSDIADNSTAATETAKVGVSGIHTVDGTNNTVVNGASLGYTRGVAADVQWSAKVSMPLAGGTAYVAMDEEGGNAFGISTTVSGVGVTFDSKLEAYEEELSIDRSNTLGVTYVMGQVTAGATWNSVEDGDQWGISAAYTDGTSSFNASTDEGSDWSVTGSYLLGTGASVVGGMNYTEDAYLGLSFSF